MIIKRIQKNIEGRISFFLILFFAVAVFFTAKAFAQGDITAPVISDVNSGSVTTKSATITWTTDENSNSLVDYGIGGVYNSTQGNVNDSVTSHTVVLTGLTPGTAYKFRVRSADANGNEAVDDNGGNGYSLTTSAAPVISNVRITEVSDTYVTVSWETDISCYGFVAFGTTSSYGRLVGNEEDFTTSHSITLAGLSVGTLYHYRPRVKDVFGDYTNYGVDSVVTAGAPFTQSFTSSSSNGTYGPGDIVNITANYNEAISAGSNIIVILNTGVQITLNGVSGNTLYGNYTVGATGSNQNTNDLTVSSIISQSACDVDSYCYLGTNLPITNIATGSQIIVDTTAPVFSNTSPDTDANINNVTTSSDISYSLSEDLNSATITITQTEGNSDPAAPHVCTLTGTALTQGNHPGFDTTNCQDGAISLVSGAIYTFSFNGQDVAGNNAAVVDETGVLYDTDPPELSSFTSTTIDATYGPVDAVNITATYNEDIFSGSTVTVTLNTGVQVTLDAITEGNKLSGTYDVGATGSGQNTSDLAVSSITTQNTIDLAGNVQTGTDLPATNISDGSNIQIDTTAPDAPSNVTFNTDPINNTNASSVTIHVEGEANATINYSIDDTNPGTAPVSSSAVTMESDGTIDISGINLSTLNDGTLTATVYLIDGAGNASSTSTDTVAKDTVNPNFNIQYYTEGGVILGDNPRLKEGSYILRITSNEPLSSTPKVTIDAQGSSNDVNTPADAVSYSGNSYDYTRTIVFDEAAYGTTLEFILVQGTDSSGNTANFVTPINLGAKSAYDDTVKPTTSGNVSPLYAKAGTVNVSLTFDENMNQAVDPVVVLTKSGGGDISVSGSFSSGTAWSGTATIDQSDANGNAVLRVSAAADAAGNVMADNNNVTSFVIDTNNPIFTVNDGTDPGPIQTDTIRITVTDSPSGVSSRFYGFSSDTTCDALDTINISFSSGVDFVIGDRHTDYLCASATDNAGNTGYHLVGQLNTDSIPPTVTDVTSDHIDGVFKAGEVIDVDVTFSENVTSAGDVTITLETGSTDRSCAFSVTNSSSASCDYTVQEGDTSSDLAVASVSGNISDQVGNVMTDFVPQTNLDENKAIVIDTTPPAVNITAPVSGNSVNGDDIISFTDDDPANPECSVNGSDWVACNSGVTTFGVITGWEALLDGPFTLSLRDSDEAGNVGIDSEADIIRDTTAPEISSVSSDHANGIFKQGEVIDIDVTFSEPATSSGDVTVTLDTGGSCSFTVSNSANASCNYTVGPGENSSDLNVTSISGVIADQTENPMTNFTPGTNLADNESIIVDTLAPHIIDITSNHEDGTFTVDEVIDIDITFSENVSSTGFVTITLDTGGSCTFTLTTSSTGTCNYIVQDEQNSLDLTVANVSGVVADQAGNPMANFIPDTNLGDNKNMVIDTSIPGNPTITNVTSTHADGAYKEGEVIDIEFTFSEAVTSTGSVAVSLDSGGGCSFSVTNATSATCGYTVEAGHNSADLNVTSVSGTIDDRGHNAMVDFNPAVNLADNKDIVIDTVPPTAPVITLLDPITDENKTAITITGTGEADATANYTISDVNLGTPDVTGSAVVTETGTINITGIDVSSLDGGTITASVTLVDAAGNISEPGIDTASSLIVRPTIVSVTSDHPDGAYKAGETIDIDVVFSEIVTSTGNVAVVLDTGGACTFTITGTTTGTCDYIVDSEENSGDLTAANISGTITDQSGNTMLNFIPAANLADNKDIVVDTTPPDAPIVTLLDPITDLNKTAVTITGNGESNAALSFSIDDTNDASSAVTGLGSVGVDGAINISGIDLSSLDGGVITVSIIQTDAAGNVSAPGTDTSTSEVTRPTITSIDTEHADGAFKAGEVIDIDVTFSETVTSTGDVTVNFDTGGTCSFTISSSLAGSCDYTVSDGENSSDLNVASVSGTISDQSGNTMITFEPATNLAANADIVVDTIVPVLQSVTSSTADGTYGPGDAIAVIATYEEEVAGGSSVTLELNTGVPSTLSATSNGEILTGTYTVGATGSGENTVDLSVQSITTQSVCDLAGNCQSGTTLPSINIADNSSIGVDTTAPEFLNVLPTSSSNISNVTNNSGISYTLSETLASGTITVTHTAWEEDPNSPHLCTLTGNDLNAGVHDRFDTTQCQEGSMTLVVGAVYSFSFYGEDLYGNISAELSRTGVSYGLDTDPPSVSNVTVASKTSDSATITWTTNEDANSLVDYGVDATYGATVGNASEEVVEHSTVISGLEAGTTYKYRVRVRDTAGNETIEDSGGVGYEFTTLSTPTISDVEVVQITTTSITIAWDSSSTAYSYLDYGTTGSYGRVIGNEEEVVTEHSITMAGLSPDTTYYYRPRIKDIYGNYSLGEESSATTLEDTSDNTDPVISNVEVSEIGAKSVKITWVTDEDADSYVEYGTTTAYGEVYGSGVLKRAHAVVLPAALTPGTTYHFRVRSKDASDNQASSDDDTFTTTPSTDDDDGGAGTGDDNGPKISGIKVSELSNNAVEVTWKTDTESNGMVRYGLDKDYGQTEAEDSTVGTATAFSKEHSVTIYNLLSNVTYHYSVVSYDASGNIAASSDKTFDTPELMAGENQGPISEVKITSVSPDSAVASWETSDPMTSFLEYGTAENNYNKEEEDTKLKNIHRVEISGLQGGTTYHLRVGGEDQDRKNSYSKDYVFATYSAPEIQRYAVANVTDSGAEVTWETNVPANSMVEYVNVGDEADRGVQGAAEEVTSHKLVLFGLKQGVEYEAKIRSTDLNRNTVETEPFRFTTTIDTTAPEIVQVNTESTLANKKEDKVQSIISWKTDEPATSQVMFDLGVKKEENSFSQQSKEDANFTTNHVVILTNLKPGVVYHFKVASKDKNSNARESDDFSLLTPKKEQSVIQLIISNFEKTFGWMKKLRL